MPPQPAIPSHTRLELLKAAWLLPWVAAMLTLDHIALFVRKTPTPTVLQRILRRSVRPVFHEPSLAERARLALMWRLATLCLHYLFFTSKPCLRRCLFLLRCCCRWQINCGLVIGVNLQPGGLMGHSWIELQGEPLFEDPVAIAQYKPVLTAHSVGGVEFHFSGQTDRDYVNTPC